MKESSYGQLAGKDSHLKNQEWRWVIFQADEEGGHVAKGLHHMGGMERQGTQIRTKYS